MKEITPDVALVITGLGVVIFLGNQMMVFWRNLNGDVSKSYATKQEHGELKATVGKEIAKLELKIESTEARLQKQIHTYEDRHARMMEELGKKMDQLKDDIRAEMKHDQKGNYRRLEILSADLQKILGKLDL